MIYGYAFPQNIIRKNSELISFGMGSIREIEDLEVWERDAYWSSLINIEKEKYQAMYGE